MIHLAHVLRTPSFFETTQFEPRDLDALKLVDRACYRAMPMSAKQRLAVHLGVEPAALPKRTWFDGRTLDSYAAIGKQLTQGVPATAILYRETIAFMLEAGLPLQTAQCLTIAYACKCPRDPNHTPEQRRDALNSSEVPRPGLLKAIVVSPIRLYGGDPGPTLFVSGIKVALLVGRYTPLPKPAHAFSVSGLVCGLNILYLGCLIGIGIIIEGPLRVAALIDYAIVHFNEFGPRPPAVVTNEPEEWHKMLHRNEACRIETEQPGQYARTWHLAEAITDQRRWDRAHRQLVPRIIGALVSQDELKTEPPTMRQAIAKSCMPSLRSTFQKPDGSWENTFSF